MQSSYDVIIIGGGYGGVSTATYLQQCGYKTLLLEKTALPGGVSTAWRRKGYLFDGATNWVAGSAPSCRIHNMMREVIDFEKLTFIDPDEFMVVEHGGESLVIYDDVDRFEAEMLRISPEDEKLIRKFADAIRDRSKVSIPYEHPLDIAPLHKKIGIIIGNIPFIKNFLQWRNVSVKEYAAKFKNETFRQLFLRMFPHHSFFSMYAIISTFAWKNLRSSGYPVGGTEALIGNMIEKYRTLGGEMLFSKEVVEINHSNGVVNAVTLKDGSEIKAQRVVAALCGKHTFQKLLGDAFVHPQLDKLLKEDAQTYPGLVQISVGTKKLFPGLRHKYNMDFPEKVKVAENELCEDMMVRICTEKSGLSPEGTTTFVVHLRIDDVHYWYDLRQKDREKYRAEKHRIADIVIKQLKDRFGDFEVDVLDTASPATYHRYSYAHKASYQGWAPTPKVIGKGLKMKIKGLSNFYLAGQWVFPAGGITGVIRVGRHLTQLICHEDKRPFSFDK